MKILAALFLLVSTTSAFAQQIECSAVLISDSPSGVSTSFDSGAATFTIKKGMKYSSDVPGLYSYTMEKGTQNLSIMFHNLKNDTKFEFVGAISFDKTLRLYGSANFTHEGYTIHRMGLECRDPDNGELYSEDFS